VQEGRQVVEARLVQAKEAEGQAYLDEAREKANACTELVRLLEIIEDNFKRAEAGALNRVQEDRRSAEAAARAADEQAAAEAEADGEEVTYLEPIEDWQRGHSHQMPPHIISKWKEVHQEEVCAYTAHVVRGVTSPVLDPYAYIYIYM
jgi:hypothetical protein